MNYTIVVTNKCNLKCSYCYEGEKDYKSMTIETADYVVDFIRKTLEESKDEKINIIFHGGEPFLNFNIIKYIKQKIDTDIKSIKHIKYEITTNGTIMNKDIIDFIHNENIKLSVSVDGTKVSHNQYRVFHDGKGSYDTVINNLDILLLNNIIPRCRMTYSSSNFKELLNGIIELKNRGISLFATSANFYDTLWTKSDIEELKLEIDKLIELSINENLNISMDDKTQICKAQSDCFGGISSFTIDPNGMIYPCVFNINNDRFIIGNVYEFSYDKIKKDMYKFHKELYFESVSICDTCNANEICKGSKCKLLNYMVTGMYGNPPAITCNMMKIELDTYKKISTIREGVY